MAMVVVASGWLAPMQRARAAPLSDVNSLGLTATYDVHAAFGWEERTADVRTTVVVANNVRWSASTIAFNLATLRTGRARIDQVLVGGAPAEATVDDQTLLVPLSSALEPAGSVTIQIDYHGGLAADAGAEGDAWEFARIDDVLTAYRWIPWLSRTTPFDRPSVGDPWVTASSPSVRVAIDIDRAVLIGSSGTRQADENGAQVFEASDVRDFNFAASPSYRTASQEVAGTTITFFYRELPPARVLSTTAEAIREFSARIAPFPHREMTIAEIGPWAPIESPAHFWLPVNAGSLLTWMVAHEVAHQWFYSAVGSDQAREPFADEALADYIARDLISRFVPSQCPEGRLDHSIYEIGDCYAWVVYVQGNAWLRRLRQRAGADRFWSALARYYSAHQTGIGGTYEVLAALVSATGTTAADYDRFPRTFPARVISLPFAPALP